MGDEVNKSALVPVNESTSSNRSSSSSLELTLLLGLVFYEFLK